MRVIDCEQGSEIWYRAKLGKATASRVCDIMRKSKDRKSYGASRGTYAGELVAERMSGTWVDGYVSAAMQHGKDTEDMARAHYGFLYDCEPVKVGFVLHPTIEMAGASPDRLIGEEGLIEIKSPLSKTHIETLLGAPIEPDYIKQMMFQMACTGRAWCDFVSFDPRMPADMMMHVRRVHRDEAAIKELEAEVRSFLAEVDATVARLIDLYRKEAA